ncbi:MAG TPA: tetratricopeptide repeat protein [Vicinamibacterales bacterium]|nr:tetratricopeptide repeat protein [Vicinamibacterales bacterium]
MRRLAALILLVSSGCASAPIKKTDAASLVVADTRLLEGCYSCLLEARDVFARVAVGKARPLVIARLFETQVLIGLRERELAMDGREAFARARALLPELPPTYAGAKYLEIAEVVPPDFSGTPRTESSAFQRGNATQVRLAEFKTGLAAGEASAPFRAYMSATLDCVLVPVRRDGQPGRVTEADLSEIPAGTSPLVKYRMATCPILRPSVLEGLLKETPSFVEAGLFLSRQATLNITSTYVKNMRTWLMGAYAVFPRSPSVTYGLGALSQTVGDCKTAIRFYEDTIALKDRHEDAALQRVVCLAHLGQFAPAIEAATRIIDRGYYNMPDAFYWRAWTHHRQMELPQARADVDRALSLLFNSRVLTLGGMIKYDQDDLGKAEADLKEAIRIDPAQCVAHWYLGLISFKKSAWPETSLRFGVCASCYERSADDNVKSLDAMRKADLDADFKAAQIAGFEAVIKEDRDQQWGAILNAANAFARSEQIDTALKWLEKIPADAALRGKADELKKLITGK